MGDVMAHVTRRVRAGVAAIAVALALVSLPPVAARLNAAEVPAVSFTIEGRAFSLDREALLKRPDLTVIDVPDDVSYHRPMRYKAVPLAPILADHGLAADDHLEVAALDGFVAQLPAALVLETRPDRARAWLALSTADGATADGATADGGWPTLPDKDADPGPFYVVWTNAAASGVTQEQWPYQVASFTATVPLLDRFPPMRVAETLPADAPERKGEQVFAVQCAACHKINGAGPAELGPDLNLPMNPTEYVQPAALKKLIRNTKSVRSWPGSVMPAFSPDELSDADIDHIVAYLTHMAGRKAGPAK
ncbi:cytochrome c [uncultured Tistrella sp.]|uniref:cytochrome c n=1 Tax=Tistrella mobilis TaxID=171437 RepID=UPI000C090EAD|nr:cytochrome c [uncultured Tistrella sp.]MAM73014.1 hypothetical protein [Tistrella sp.]